MAEYTVIAADFDEESGVSWTTINSKWGKFTGAVTVADSDRDIASQFLGCEFAEYKAYIMLLEKKARMFRERAKGVQEAIDILDFKFKQMDMSYDDAFLQKLNLSRVRDNLYRQSNEIKNKANNLKDNYKFHCEVNIALKRQIVAKYSKK